MLDRMNKKFFCQFNLQYNITYTSSGFTLKCSGQATSVPTASPIVSHSLGIGTGKGADLSTASSMETRMQLWGNGTP